MATQTWDEDTVRRTRYRAYVIQVMVIIIGLAATLGVGAALYSNALHTQLEEYRLKCTNRQEVLYFSFPFLPFACLPYGLYTQRLLRFIGVRVAIS